MRIVIFSDSLPPRVDGIAIAVQQLAIGLVQAGHHVLLVGPGGRAVGTGADIAPGAEFLRLPFVVTGFDGYPFTVPRRSTISRALGEFRPDVVSVQTVGPIGLTGLSLARRLGTPSLFSWHTDFESYARAYRMSPRLLAAGSYLPFVLGRHGTTESTGAGGTRGLIPASLRRASRWMSAVCAPCTESADQVRRFGVRRPVYVMPAEVTPADLGVGSEAARQALRSVPEAGVTPYLLFVGRLSREKNLELLLEAFIRGVPAPTRLVLVGPANDARMRAMLQARVAERPGRIVVLGTLARAELGEIYRAAAGFVTPSRSETQCLCICEAVTLKVPVLVVDPHLARDRPEGAVRVVPADPEALALAMTDLVQADRATGRKAGREADRGAGPVVAGPAVRPEPMAALATRFVAAAESAGTMPPGANLHWHERRWVVG